MENILPRPPPEVLISMLGDIHTIEPFSVTICSPSASWQTTTGKAPPFSSYVIISRPFSIICYYQYTAFFRPTQGAGAETGKN